MAIRGLRDEITVLHVDDDGAVADVTAEHLEREDTEIEVRTETDPEAALDRIAEDPVDCVVSDYDMPGTDGIGLLEEVREHHGELPFILYTSKGSEEVASEAIGAGVTDYLRKRTGEENYRLLANRIVEAVERQRAETSYREIFENVPDGIVVHDPETGEFLDMNERYAEMYGYDREEFLELGFEAIHPEDSPFTLEEAREKVRAAHEDGPQSFDWLAERKDGETFWASVHLAEMALHGEDRIVAMVRDIDEEKRRERELRETKETLEAVIEASPDAIMVVGVDGDITMWNAAAEEIFGWSEDEILGEPNPLIPDDRQEEYEQHKRRAFSGESIAGKETTRLTKEGETVDVSLSTAPVRDADGEIVGGMAVLEDITERKRHERRLEAIIENTTNPIYFKDRSGEYRLINEAAAQLFEMAPEDVVGKTDRELFDAESAERLREQDRRVIETGESVSEEMAVSVDGEGYVFLDNMFPYRNDDGEIIGTMGVSIEITERKQREQQLERYERIVDNLPVGVYRTDDDGTILDVNRAAAEIAGLEDPDSLRGQSIDQFYPESEPREQLIDRLRDEGAVEGVEVEAVTAEGERIWVEVTSRSVEEDGEIYYDGIVRDVTARKQRQQELERHERIVQNLPVAVYRTDESGTILDANPQAVAVIGGDGEDQVEGRNVLELYSDEAGRKAITDELLEHGRIDGAEVEAQTLDGDTVWLQITSRRVEEGDDVYYDGIARDVTDRKLRERELERARELLAQAQEVADVAGWSFDLSGDPPHHPEWTDKMYDLLAFPQDERPPPLDEMIDRYLDEDRERRDAAVERALDQGEEWDVEARIRCFDGEVKWVREIARPEFEDGELVHVRGSFQDITERKEREREIERQNERLEAFAELVSHDLRNPLNVAQGRLDLARRDGEGDGEHLEAVADAHDRIEGLIEDMLALARQGDDGVSEDPLDLASVAEDAWDSVPTEDAAVETAASATIRGDRDQVQRMLENLFRNAVTHGGDGVTVRVDDAADGFVVEDDGEGFPEDAEGLLELGESTDPGGTGFGLAIVDRVAERHGWDVALGASDDGGARVTVTGVERA